MTARLLAFMIKHCRLPSAEPGKVAQNRLWFATASAVAVMLILSVQVASLAMVQPITPDKVAEKPETVLRGKIYDSKGRVLATSFPAWELYADPARVMNPRAAAEALDPLLPHLTEAEILKRLKRKSRYVELDWKISSATYASVLEAGIVGVYARQRPIRSYPFLNEAAHLLGGVNKDGKGIAGVEAGFDEILARGDDLTLSVDIAVQSILREEIEHQIERFEAIGGAGVVLDAHTGEIVAMVSLPDYDANFLGSADADARFNRASKGVYELGSTFKIFNTAMALDSGIFAATDMIDVVSPLRVGRFSIRDHHPEKRPLNVAEVMVVSSNKGSGRIADRMGAEIQQHYIKALGLMDRLDIGLPESADPITPKRWKRAEIITISYGYGLSVTPVHLVSAIATTVGTGRRIQPSLIKGGHQDSVEEQVFDEKTARMIRPIMRRVVTHRRGTGKKANAPGYAVGGKTGTSEKINSTSGYNRKVNITTFAGIFPAHDPRYVVMVMVDAPKGQKFSHGWATGGWVAAPAVRRFVSRAAPLLGVHPVDEKSPEISQILDIKLPNLEPEVKNVSQ
ncbi:MAG: peptidoglycan D,D-transpeptidase FtsI family protein [Candidatus Puniceispirillales bacterium]